jgi:hypothetical protein
LRDRRDHDRSVEGIGSAIAVPVFERFETMLLSRVYKSYQWSWGLCELAIIIVAGRWIARACKGRFTNKGFLGMFLEESHREGGLGGPGMI